MLRGFAVIINKNKISTWGLLGISGASNESTLDDLLCLHTRDKGDPGKSFLSLGKFIKVINEVWAAAEQLWSPLWWTSCSLRAGTLPRQGDCSKQAGCRPHTRGCQGLWRLQDSWTRNIQKTATGRVLSTRQSGFPHCMDHFPVIHLRRNGRYINFPNGMER